MIHTDMHELHYEYEEEVFLGYPGRLVNRLEESLIWPHPDNVQQDVIGKAEFA